MAVPARSAYFAAWTHFTLYTAGMGLIMEVETLSTVICTFLCVVMILVDAMQSADLGALFAGTVPVLLSASAVRLPALP